jgi:hypothetical protein
MFWLAGALLLGNAGSAFAQSAIIGDAWILGKVSVGTTTVTDARFYVLASSATEVPFRVSGVDLTPFLRVSRDGTVGLSTYSAAHLDVSGSADGSDIAVMLRSGNLAGSGTDRTQIAFGANGSTSRRHTITSVHTDSTSANVLNFQIWEPGAGSAATLATMTVVSLVTSSQAFLGAVHVMPVGAPQAQLTISNGASTGGGTLHAANWVTSSSRKLKRDIAYLDAGDEDRALEEVRALKHVRFRYMRQRGGRLVRDSRAIMRRGLIFEESPDAIKGPFDSLSLDQRLVESEMAFKAMARRLEALETEAAR